MRSEPNNHNIELATCVTLFLLFTGSNSEIGAVADLAGSIGYVVDCVRSRIRTRLQRLVGNADGRCIVGYWFRDYVVFDHVAESTQEDPGVTQELILTDHLLFATEGYKDDERT